MERTLVMIKPDGVKHGILESFLPAARQAGELTQVRMTRLTRSEAENLYSEHKGKSFFERNIDHITSGPVVLIVVEGDSVIDSCRKIALDIRERNKELINLPANLIHATDSQPKVDHELKAVGLEKSP